MIKHLAFKTLLLISLAVLNACGGGGVSESFSTDGNQTAGISVEGVASRGLLINAPYRVYAAKVPGTTLASGTTGENGEYSFQLKSLPANSSPIVIEVSMGNKTVMLNEAGALLPDGSFPQASKLPPLDFKMRAIIPFSNLNVTETQTFNVTPFSEFVVRMALSATTENSLGKVTDQQIQLSRLFLVNSLGGLDPITTKAANANAVFFTPDQERLMLLLIGMQHIANNSSCTGDPSGVTCVMNNFWSFAQMKVSNDVATFPSASNMKVALGRYITEAKTNMAGRTSDFHRDVRSQVIALETVNSFGVQAAQTAYGLQSFLTDLRTGIVRGADNLANGLKILTNNFDGLVPDENYKLSDLSSAIKNSCSWAKTPDSVSGYGLNCVNGPNFTVTPLAGFANSNYDLRHTVNVANRIYVATGRMSVGRYPVEGLATVQGDLKVFNCPKTQTTNLSNCIAVSEMQVNATMTSNVDISLNKFNSINLDRLAVKVFDGRIRTKSNTIEITGLTLSKTSDINYVSGMGNLTLTNSTGNRVNGRISNLVIRDFPAGHWQAQSKLTSVRIDLDAGISPTAPFSAFTFKFNGSPSVGYAPFMPTTSSNFFLENYNLSITFPNIGTNTINFNQLTHNTADVDIRLTNPSGRFISAKGPLVHVVSKDDWVVSSSGVEITSSSPYSAKIYSDWLSGEFLGNIFSNGDQIGAILPNGLITANGIEMSLR